jgi:hypothetical protein
VKQAQTQVQLQVQQAQEVKQALHVEAQQQGQQRLSQLQD